MHERIVQMCQDSIAMLSELAEYHSDDIARAAQMMVSALVNENRLICCGNGASGANVQSFVSKLLNRFEHERPALPAIALAPDSITLSALAQDNRLTESFQGHYSQLLSPMMLWWCYRHPPMLRILSPSFAQHMNATVMSSL